MKKIICVLIVTLFYLGCAIEPMESETVGKDTKVELLFVKDGIAVYRFNDIGRRVYFTKSNVEYTTGGKNPMTVQTLGN